MTYRDIETDKVACADEQTDQQRSDSVISLIAFCAQSRVVKTLFTLS